MSYRRRRSPRISVTLWRNGLSCIRPEPVDAYIKVIGPIVVRNLCHRLHHLEQIRVIWAWKQPIPYGVHELAPIAGGGLKRNCENVELAKLIRPGRLPCLVLACSRPLGLGYPFPCRTFKG